MLFNRSSESIGLLGILSFHLGIALLMGLPGFSLTMIAVDVIFTATAASKSPQAGESLAEVTSDGMERAK